MSKQFYTNLHYMMNYEETNIHKKSFPRVQVDIVNTRVIIDILTLIFKFSRRKQIFNSAELNKTNSMDFYK